MASPKNVEVKVAVPKHERLKFIFAAGHSWPTGLQTSKVISRADSEQLLEETRRSLKDPVTGKEIGLSRFTVLVGNETDAAAEPRVKHQGVAKLEFRKSAMEQQTAALKDAIGMLVESNAKTADALAMFAGKLKAA